MQPVEIPDKLYFKIGEVASIAGVEAYVLRYWESAFKEISPVKSRTNQRLYRKRDIETVLWIKQLLYQEGFTIEGAKKKLRENPSSDQLALPMNNGKLTGFLKKLQKELEELLKILET